MRRAIKILSVVLVFVLGGCGFLTDARNAIATASTFLAAEQTQNQASCTANPTQPVCQAINKGIAANNALIDAVNVYCGGVPATGVPGWAQGGACVPVNTAQAAVNSAVANLNQVLADVKALTKSAPAAPAPTKVSLLEYRKTDLDAVRMRGF